MEIMLKQNKSIIDLIEELLKIGAGKDFVTIDIAILSQRINKSRSMVNKYLNLLTANGFLIKKQGDTYSRLSNYKSANKYLVVEHNVKFLYR